MHPGFVTAAALQSNSVWPALPSALGRAHSKFAAVVPRSEGLGANQRLVRQFGQRIIEIAPGRDAEIAGVVLAEVARHRTSHDVESDDAVAIRRLDQVAGRIKGKPQGNRPCAALVIDLGESERRSTPWADMRHRQRDIRPQAIDAPGSVRNDLDRVVALNAACHEFVEKRHREAGEAQIHRAAHRWLRRQFRRPTLVALPRAIDDAVDVSVGEASRFRGLTRAQPPGGPPAPRAASKRALSNPFRPQASCARQSGSFAIAAPSAASAHCRSR